MKPSTTAILLAIALCGNGYAVDKSEPVSVDQAIELVDKPAHGFASMSPFELQAHYRLAWLRRQGRYTYVEKDAPAWKACMTDKKRSMYARLCAAYFLLDKDEDARKFVATQTASENLRHRYNAAEVVRLYVGSDAKKEWGVDLLIKLVADRSLDGSGISGSPGGEYPEEDRDDIMFTPVDRICRSLGFMKEKKAVPALISILERNHKISGAVDALGAIGDERTIPILLTIVKEETGRESDAVRALGELKCKQAVPILIERLGSPSDDPRRSGSGETEDILQALLLIGDKKAVKPIKEYLQGDGPDESKAVARRVLAQLESPDPASTLLELLDKETYEPERSDIIEALAKYADDRVVKTLATIARTSDSAFMRREAILGLRDIGNRQSLLALAALLDVKFAKDLKAEWGWKGPPDFEKYFPETIVMCLKQRTKQEFGEDRGKWEEWIKENIKPESRPR